MEGESNFTESFISKVNHV